MSLRWMVLALDNSNWYTRCDTQGISQVEFALHDQTGGCQCQAIRSSTDTMGVQRIVSVRSKDETVEQEPAMLNKAVVTDFCLEWSNVHGRVFFGKC